MNYFFIIVDECQENINFRTYCDDADDDVFITSMVTDE